MHKSYPIPSALAKIRGNCQIPLFLPEKGAEGDLRRLFQKAKTDIKIAT
jgi:hypothetical protein